MVYMNFMNCKERWSEPLTLKYHKQAAKTIFQFGSCIVDARKTTTGNSSLLNMFRTVTESKKKKRISYFTPLHFKEHLKQPTGNLCFIHQDGYEKKSWPVAFINLQPPFHWLFITVFHFHFLLILFIRHLWLNLFAFKELIEGRLPML